MRTPNAVFACGVHLVPGADEALFLGGTNRLTTHSCVGLGTAVVLRRPRARFYRLTDDVAVKARFELHQNNTMVFAELARSGCGLTF